MADDPKKTAQKKVKLTRTAKDGSWQLSVATAEQKSVVKLSAEEAQGLADQLQEQLGENFG